MNLNLVKMELTIITVCYNAVEDLKITLDSVLNQSYIDCEYLIIDGGSLDGTVELLKGYQPRFEAKGILFRYVSERDKGTYDAMNKGADLAQGEWINYMNAGDSFFSDDTLKQFFAHDINSNSGVLYGDTLQIFDFGGGIAKASDYRKDNPVMPFCHQSCFVRTDLMRKYRFDLSYRIIADHDLFYRLHQDGICCHYIEVTVARYNGQYGLSATHPLLLHKEGLRVHHVTERWYYPLALAWVYLGYGWIQAFKSHMPRWMTHMWMKYKRRKFIE